MIIIRQHIEGDLEATAYVDMASGRTISINNTRKDYREMVAKIEEILADESTTIHTIEEVVQGSNTKHNMETVRENNGIVIDDNGNVTIDGVELPAGIAKVFHAVKDEQDIPRLKKFVALLKDNPYDHAKEALVSWILANPSLEILDDGRIRGYRGLRPDYRSIHSGYGIVNGEEVNDHLDNTPGNVIQFPSAMIDHNPNNYCSVGIHVGTWEYARGFGDGKYVSVAFSPADVVSFPADAYQKKIRVCEIEVLQEINYNPERDFDRLDPYYDNDEIEGFNASPTYY